MPSVFSSPVGIERTDVSENASRNYDAIASSEISVLGRSICTIKAVARSVRRGVRIESGCSVIDRLTMKDQRTWISFAVTASHDDDDMVMVCYDELGDES